MADAEASRGHRGSANLRVEAFMALRVLVAKVTTKYAYRVCYIVFLLDHF